MRPPRRLPSREVLEKHFRYDSQTGTLYRRNGTSEAAVERSPSQRYLRVDLNGAKLYAHRVIWKLFYGEDAAGLIDHADCDKANNRVENLRIATAAQNVVNRMPTPGRALPPGVFFDKGRDRYRARIRAAGKNRYLGDFHTAEDAASAYRAAAALTYGEFARGTEG